MLDVLFYLLIVVVLAALLVGAGFAVRSYVNGTSPMAAFFGPKPERRLDILEQYNIDNRRRLVLIRRDKVEHLIMTGGPVDMVIETGIAGQPAPAVATDNPTVVFERVPRTFGKTAAEQ